MTDQQNSPGTDDPVADLQPLTFLRKDDNGTAAIYQSRIDNGDAVYTLTVTTASPGQDQQQAEQLAAFLAAMQAKFALTTLTSGVGPPGGQNPEPFNVDLGTLIEPDLVEVHTGTGPFGFTVTVLTSVGPELTETQDGLAQPHRAFTGHVQLRQAHYYTARDKTMDTATVWAVQGSGKVGTAWPPTQPITQGGNSKSLGPAKTVIVEGTSNRPCIYYFDGRFQ